MDRLLTLRILGCDAEEEQASRQEIVNLARLTESESDVDPSQREFYERIAENFKYIPRDAAHYDALKHLVDVLESSEFEGLFDTVPEAMQTATQQTEALSSGGILATIVAIVTFGWLRKSQQ